MSRTPKAQALFDDIAAFRPLCEAAQRAAKGKRSVPGVAAFMGRLETYALWLEAALQAGHWRPGRYRIIHITDPKPRQVSAAPFRDRVVHHALCAVIQPLFERGFIHDSYANRVGKGTHRAVARYEDYLNRYDHVLRCDIYRFFPAIDHAVLKADIARRIACPRTLELIARVIDSSNLQEPVNTYYPGDDLFTPFERRRGLPIGNLTSQLFANIYLDRLDHFVKEVLRAPGYVRYVDDFALFHDDPAVLQRWQAQIAAFLQKRRLSLHPHKTRVQPCDERADFLGYSCIAGGPRRLPEASVRRFRHRLRGLRDRWRQGRAQAQDIQQRVQAWVAHAEHAQTWRLRHAIFRGGWFDPALGQDAASDPKAWRASYPAGQPWRQLEQQRTQRALGQPQQQHDHKSEQQLGVSFSQHVAAPEPLTSSESAGVHSSVQRPSG